MPSPTPSRTDQQPPPAYAKGARVEVVAAPESGGIYAQLLGRTGRVVDVLDYRPHHLPLVDVLFTVAVPGFVPMPFSAHELRPAPGPVGPLPRLVDCDVCAGSGVMSARPGSLAGLLGEASVVLCPRCDGRGAFLEQVVDVLPDLACWGRS